MNELNCVHLDTNTFGKTPIFKDNWNFWQHFLDLSFIYEIDVQIYVMIHLQWEQGSSILGKIYTNQDFVTGIGYYTMSLVIRNLFWFDNSPTKSMLDIYNVFTKISRNSRQWNNFSKIHLKKWILLDKQDSCYSIYPSL